MASPPFDISQLLQPGMVPQMGPDLMGGQEPAPDADMAFDFAPTGNPIFEMGPDGEMREAIPDEDMISAQSPDEHNANLAEFVSESALSTIASNLLEEIEENIEVRQPHMDRFKRGLEMMGLKQDAMDDGPFAGASTATAPLISEAIVQFWARALAELCPSEGPAKAKVVGKQSTQLLDRARRVETYMNHEILFIDESWYGEHSRLTWAVPFHGDAFKKIYRDPILNRNVSVYVPVEDFIAPSNVSDLKSAPNFAHRIWRTRNELRKLQVAGFYRDTPLAAPDQEDLTEAATLRAEAQDITPGTDGDDARHELFEVNCELDLEGFEDENGIKLPYIVTVDKNSSKVLSIYRGWKANDPLKRRRLCWVQYSYIKGLGFYSLGLFHLIGGLQEAATGTLRILLDGGATASLQGGFVAKDANFSEGRYEIEPGVWKPIDATSEDLAKAFFTPPFKEPSPALANLLSFLVQRAEKFAATTEAMTGSQDVKGAPVGSTLAIIEQGAKVFSTIHRGMHMAMAQELRLRFELIQEFMPQEGYPYDVEGAHEGILAEDFAPGVSIQPVSDPNIFSSAQRLAIAQATYEIALNNQDVLKKDVAVRRILEAMKVPDIEELLVQHSPPPPMDPVSEIQALLRGEPVQAYPDQLHDAYLQHYQSFIQNPQYGGNPEVQKHVGPAVTALIGQRLAYAWATHARAMGAMAPMLPPPMQGQGQQGPQQQLPPPQMPPEQLAEIAARIAPQMAQVPGMPAPPTPQDQKAQADAQVSQAKAQAAQGDARLREVAAQEKIQQQRELHAIRVQNERDLAQGQMAQLAQKIQAQQDKSDREAQSAWVDTLRAEDAHNQAMAQDQIDAARQQQMDDERQAMEQASALQSMAQDQQQIDLEATIAEANAAHERKLKAKETVAKTSEIKRRGRKPKGEANG